MPDAETFLQAIVEQPNDDVPRLIYADWLQEHGDPDRAEFIRLQCALARGTASGERLTLEARAEELRSRHESAWTPALPGRQRSLRLEFQRGFVHGIRMEARAFVACAEELFRVAPVRELQLFWGADPPHERARFMQTIAEIPFLSRLQGLDLTDSYIGSDGARALAASEYPCELTALHLQGSHIGERGIRALVEASWFRNLHSLDLRNNDINAGAARALADGLEALESKGQLRLTSLLPGGNGLRAAGLRIIRDSRVLRRVVRM